MSTIGSDLYKSLGLSTGSTVAKKEEALGQADFLKLMTEQLQHQDPLKPMENSAFLGQLAQFSTVQGIGDLNTKVGDFSAAMSNDQVLKGAALVGHNVLVPSPQVAIDGTGSSKGVVSSTAAGTVNFEITDANGTFVKQISVPSPAPGEVPLRGTAPTPMAIACPPASTASPRHRPIRPVPRASCLPTWMHRWTASPSAQRACTST